MFSIVSEKRCSSCKEEKPLSEFFKSKGRHKFGVGAWCKSCIKRKKDPRKSLNGNLKSMYGIGVETYEEMYVSCQGKCLICGVRKTRLCVDHDHATGKIRGLLCHHCNFILGFAKDSIEILEKAKLYLSTYG